MVAAHTILRSLPRTSWPTPSTHQQHARNQCGLQLHQRPHRRHAVQPPRTRLPPAWRRYCTAASLQLPLRPRCQWCDRYRRLQQRPLSLPLPPQLRPGAPAPAPCRQCRKQHRSRASRSVLPRPPPLHRCSGLFHQWLLLWHPGLPSLPTCLPVARGAASSAALFTRHRPLSRSQPCRSSRQRLRLRQQQHLPPATARNARRRPPSQLLPRLRCLRGGRFRRRPSRCLRHRPPALRHNRLPARQPHPQPYRQLPSRRP